ncbi:MAG: helix-turn-helix domain-containing protein [Planctomycetes bacterium]|nr:helix-turn-helix domain-containing protein [Planctomycetota bacterium]
MSTDLPILVLTVDEVAVVLRTTPTTVVRYVHRGLLPAIQVGKERRYRLTDVEEFIACRPPTCSPRPKAHNVGR